MPRPDVPRSASPSGRNVGAVMDSRTRVEYRERQAFVSELVTPVVIRLRDKKCDRSESGDPAPAGQR